MSEMVSIEEAFQWVSQTVKPLLAEEISLDQAAGRVLASPVFADRDSPPWRKSMMDGFAVLASDITPSRTPLAIAETVTAGDSPSIAISPGQATRIMTGAPVPAGADAIVMIEQCQIDETKQTVVIGLDSIPSGKHLMQRATNFADGDEIFSAGRRIRAIDIGLLAEIGAAKVSVFKKPTAAILPTGNELVGAEQTPAGPQIRNSNGPMLRAMLEARDLTVTDLGIGRDDPDQMLPLLKAGLKHDLFLLSGGVSAGTLDLVPHLLQQLGVQQIFHKVKVKPGKPIFFGVHTRADGSCGYVFGLPGNPVSSLVGFRLFVSAAISILTGEDAELNSPIQLAKISCDHETRGDRPTFWPARRVTSPDSTLRVEPLNWNGSSDLVALGLAEGLIAFPAAGTLHAAGSEFPFWEL